ncbi:uncharacterized protein MELLADRAFT_63195 [Melampsora larici-populina 98AG31]|uniref:Uncharacterized protein n=1 Tax=Melampsora larici-populina (strain 98AG31 / pathotype 3-4-7) TaxID=747676 RepID=F4RLS6_MELLP|nr:uncharacterized protein MELLADRAFT_63195 [Melampsora larici-populina 98AG31]EGG06589.1 hypothetical protein MELLADRAFT_63195 [Melampsora larici-populina 98AG31]
MTDFQLTQLQRAKASSHLCILVALDKDIDYSKFLCSVPRLREMMDLFGIEHKSLGSKTKKDEVVKHYRKYAAPTIDELLLHLQKHATSDSPLAEPTASSPSTSDGDIDMNGESALGVPSSSTRLRSRPKPESTNSTPTSSTDNLETTGNLKNLKSKSKVNDLRVGLKNSVDKMVSRGFNKSALVKLRKHVNNKRNQGPRPSITPGNIRRPHVLKLEEIQTKDRDAIRQALQILCPQVWIPTSVVVSRPMLVAIYNLFLCEGEEPDLCQGVHFDIIPMDELNFDGYISF